MAQVAKSLECHTLKIIEFRVGLGVWNGELGFEDGGLSLGWWFKGLGFGKT